MEYEDLESPKLAKPIKDQFQGYPRFKGQERPANFLPATANNMARNFAEEATLMFCWSVFLNTARWAFVVYTDFNLPIGFAFVLPPAVLPLWQRGRMPVICIQFAQALCGTLQYWKAFTAFWGHLVGASVAAYLLNLLDLELVSNPQLADGIGIWQGMFIEALMLCYVALLLLFLPNQLSKHGLPQLLFMGAMMPVMKYVGAPTTGPSMQPLMALSAKMVTGGVEAAAEAFVPYMIGPFLGALATAAIMRRQKAPFQETVCRVCYWVFQRRTKSDTRTNNPVADHCC